MDRISDELATIDLGDKRLDRRALLLAERLASSPMKSIPAACQGWAETQAAYRLFDQPAVDAWSILEPHILCTEERMRAQPVVLCLQDTTSLDYNGQDIEGLGPIQYELERGLFLHPTYTVTPAREPLGILDCWSWARKLRGADGERPADIPESQRWIDGYERVAGVAATMPVTRLVYVADREDATAGSGALAVHDHRLADQSADATRSGASGSRCGAPVRDRGVAGGVPAARQGGADEGPATTTGGATDRFYEWFSRTQERRRTRRTNNYGKGSSRSPCVSPASSSRALRAAPADELV